MKRIINYKLLRKCLILAVMIVGLVFVASSDRYNQQVEAAPCCEGCTGGGDPVETSNECFNQYPFDIPGYNNCVSNAEQCYSRCVYCFGGSGGSGSYCNSSSDCLYNYNCGADNECHRF